MTAIAEVLSPNDYARLVAVADESAPWPPVECPEWCSEGHHPDHEADDRNCNSLVCSIPLLIESVGHGYRRNPPAEVEFNIFRRRYVGRDLIVTASLDIDGGVEAVVNLTATEARQLAAALLLAVDDGAAS
jgi:hypothetical protein